MKKTGWVTFVGAGPGNPDLMTLGGKRALETAEVILYDRLVGDGILAMMPKAAKLVDVGKSSKHHKVPQDKINELIVKYGSEGKRVVRLKGGDSYLFGRGGEEIRGLREAGIPFSVIPGVTSAVAVPAFGGIPVTHRDYSSSLHIFTGHRKAGTCLDLPYKEAAAMKGTLVFLMGLSALEEICQGLITAGMSREMPAALLENGTLPAQRSLVSTIQDISEQAKQAGFHPPGILVVGRTAALHEELDFTSHLPLWGREVLVVSSMKTGGRLSAKLRDYGCSVTEHSCLELKPDERSLPSADQMKGYSWLLFTSAFGVDCFFAKLRTSHIDVRSLAEVKIGVIGRMTAKALEQHGMYPDYIPDVFDGSSFAAGICERLTAADKVLIYRAKGGTPEIPARLREQGIDFDDIPAYEGIYQNAGQDFLWDKLKRNAFDVLTFTSTSGVEGFTAAADESWYQGQKVLCIGRQTAEAAAKYGMDASISSEATVDSMVEWIRETLGRKK